VELAVGQAEGVLEHPVGLADQLHVAVLDAVVDHLHVVAGPARSDPFAAGDVALGPDLGGDGLEDRLDQRPGRGAAAGHHAGTLQGPFFPAGDPGADVQEALGLDVLRAPLGVGEMRVAAVDDHVARRKQGDQLLDEIIDGRAGLHHEHHLARGGEGVDQLLEGVAAHELLARRPARQEIVHLARGPVEHGHAEPPALHVESQVLAHHRQPDQSEIALVCHCLACLFNRRLAPQGLLRRGRGHLLGGLRSVATGAAATLHWGTARQDNFFGEKRAQRLGPTAASASAPIAILPGGTHQGMSEHSTARTATHQLAAGAGSGGSNSA